MSDELPASAEAPAVTGMPRVDEAHQRKPRPRPDAQGTTQTTAVATGAHDQDAPRRRATQPPRSLAQLEGIVHGVHRSIGVGLGEVRAGPEPSPFATN